MHGDCMCSRCSGTKKVIVGALLLLNALLWPKWLGIDGWVQWFAVLLVLGGVLKLVMPMCPHCAKGMCGSWPAEPETKKKK